MRLGLALLTSLLLAGGCKSGAPSAEDEAAVKAQKDLLARRDALIDARRKLQADRAKIDDQIKQTKAAGSDATELEKKAADLDAQLTDKDKASSNLESEIHALGDKVGDVTSRERAAADREKVASEREQRAAEREQRAAEREKAAADREVAANQRAQECTASAAPVIMQVQAPVKPGANYTKADVLPLLQRARNAIQKKGLLPSDLGTLGSLEGESTKAMADGDMGKAFLAANTLAQSVEAIKVDQNFIRAKVSRFNQAWSGHKQDAATEKQIQDGTTEVTRAFSDGKFADANNRLNALFGQLK